MDVRDDRQDRATNDLLEGLAGALVGHGDASDLAAAFLELLDLPDRRVNVVRQGRAHRLDRDRRAAADRRAAPPAAPGLAAGRWLGAVPGRVQIAPELGG